MLRIAPEQLLQNRSEVAVVHLDFPLQASHKPRWWMLKVADNGRLGLAAGLLVWSEKNLARDAKKCQIPCFCFESPPLSVLPARLPSENFKVHSLSTQLLHSFFSDLQHHSRHSTECQTHQPVYRLTVRPSSEPHIKMSRVVPTTLRSLIAGLINYMSTFSGNSNSLISLDSSPCIGIGRTDQSNLSITCLQLGRLSSGCTANPHPSNFTLPLL